MAQSDEVEASLDEVEEPQDFAAPEATEPVKRDPLAGLA